MAKEEFTISIFDNVIKEFEKHNLSLDIYTQDHVNLLQSLEDIEQEGMRRHNGDIVWQGWHWSGQHQYKNIKNLMQEYVDGQGI